MKVLKAFVFNTLKQRKVNNARAFYHSKLCSLALIGFYTYLKQRQGRAGLKSKMMRLLQRKCSRIFQQAFTHWRSRFNERRYETEAITEFQKFRSLKLKRKAFGYLAAVCEQQQRIRDMARRAQAYFSSKRSMRTQYQVLRALKQNVRQYRRVPAADLELQALRFNAFSIAARHFRAWRRELRMNRNRQVRSRMYAIFSAWKFHTKERGLLKRYLREYSGIETSLMSTVELKENYSRVQSSSHIFGGRQELSPIENEINMSPQFTKGQI